jgi:hypothetical protein
LLSPLEIEIHSTASTIRSTASAALRIASLTASAEGASNKWRQTSSSGRKLVRT